MRSRRLLGFAYIAADVIAAQLFNLLALLILSLAAGNDQMRDAASSAWSSPVLQLWTPAYLATTLLFLSAFFAATRIRGQIESTAVSHGLSARIAVAVSSLVCPLGFVVATPLVIAAIGFSAGERKALLGAGVVVLLSVPVYVKLASLFAPDGSATRKKGLVAIGVALALTVAFLLVVATHQRTAKALGGLGILVTAIAFWSTVFTLIAALVGSRLRGAFIALCIAWGIWLAFGSAREAYRFPLHVASAPPSIFPVRLPDLRNYTAAWISARTRGIDSNGPIPIYLIAAEGGGIRAAYNAARLLGLRNLVTNGLFGKYTLAYSGVSGGSLGLVTYLGATAQNASPSKALSQIDAFYAKDLLSPTLARLLLIEPLNVATFGLLPFDRRDALFEHQVANDFHDATSSDVFALPFHSALTAISAEIPPVVLLNATRMETGRPVVIGNVHTEAVSWNGMAIESKDLLDLDRPWASPTLTLAEAVHLSARFPLFSPPASVYAPRFSFNGVTPEQRQIPEACQYVGADPACGVWRAERWGTVVDGGYYDNSGAATLLEVFREMVSLRAGAQADGTSHLKNISLHVLVIRSDPRAQDWQRVDTFPDPKTNADAAITTLLDVRETLAAIAVEQLKLEVRKSLLSAPNNVCGGFGGGSLARGPHLDITIAETARDALKGDPPCERLVDTFEEYQTDVVNDQGMLDALRSHGKNLEPDCEDVLTVRGPPLGWMLSAQSQRIIKCLTSSTVYYPGSSAVFPRTYGYWLRAEQARRAVPLPQGERVTVVEYYHPDLNHYFLTSDPQELTILDGPGVAGWTRTGQSFQAYTKVSVQTAPVCRFFSTAFEPKSAHAYTSLCDLYKKDPRWKFEGVAFWAAVPDAVGNCPAGTLPLYGLHDRDLQDLKKTPVPGEARAPSYRYTTSSAQRLEMMRKGWWFEGSGPSGVAMCVSS